MQFGKKRNVQNVYDGLYISPKSMQHSIISYQLRKIILVGDSMRKYECKKDRILFDLNLILLPMDQRPQA